MLRTMMKSKIHRATVTQADLHYVGSVTVDADLLDAADLLPGELVHIVDITNGARLETTDRGRGPRVIGINGAAARRPPRRPGDPDRLRPDRDRRGAGVRAASGLRGRRQRDHRPARRRRGTEPAAVGAWRPAVGAHLPLCPQRDHAPLAGCPAARGAAPGWTTTADVVVIGSGIAGLTAALRLRGQVDKVLVVTKDVLAAGSTQ